MILESAIATQARLEPKSIALHVPTHLSALSYMATAMVNPLVHQGPQQPTQNHTQAAKSECLPENFAHADPRQQTTF